jgi:predicted alpha/beta-fold hydrolase
MPVTPATEEPVSDGGFRSPWWLKGSHVQTIGPSLFAPHARVRYARERWDTPDGDFIDVDRAAPTGSGSRATLIVFHGLESDAKSRYVRGLMAAATARGWHGIAPHFRGCSGTLNRQPRFYHSGDSAEIDWILHRVVAEVDGAMPIVAAGVSLGGNMLLKWLGEQGEDAPKLIRAAAAISAPMDLVAGGWHLGRGFNRFYTWMFLRTLKAKSLAKLDQHADLFDRDRVKAARTLHAFDNAVTAPLHGFRDADDYWQRASSKSTLKRIATPTLILNARNDPFLPPSALPTSADVSSSVTLEQPAEGGHVGFVDAGPDGVEWMPRHVVRYLERHLG